MRKIQCVGDIHGDFYRLKEIIKEHKGTTIVLGDVGIGFIHKYHNPTFIFDPTQPLMLEKITNFQCNREQMLFLRGNHDNVEMCRAHHNYLGEYGVYRGIFYVSGAFSVDRAFRTEGIDWWSEEELSMEQCYKALEMYKTTKPKIVISHDCPTNILSLIYSQIIPTRTGQLLQAMFEEHQPEKWYFAHHHKGWQGELKGTTFRCLDCYEIALVS
jgi:Icc-related predicted phosphoesterase